MSRVARVYARALYETAKSKNGAVGGIQEVSEQLDAVLKAIKTNTSLEVALYSPVASAREKKKILEELGKKAKLLDLVTHFLELLASKGRLSVLPQIREALDEVRLEAENGMLGRLVSADPIEEKDVKAIAQSFEKKFGKTVEFRVSTDPSLLAGLKVTIGGVTYDGTLKAQLEQLKDAFVQGTSLIQ